MNTGTSACEKTTKERLIRTLQISARQYNVRLSFTESPLQFYVNNANSPNVTAYGPGLVYGVANKPATFTIYTDDAAEGERYCCLLSCSMNERGNIK